MSCILPLLRSFRLSFVVEERVDVDNRVVILFELEREDQIVCLTAGRVVEMVMGGPFKSDPFLLRLFFILMSIPILEAILDRASINFCRN